MMRQIAFALTVLIGMFIFAGFIVAQDSESEDSLVRLVCIETIGCLHTPLTDEALDMQFGTELQRYETEVDFEPSGVWNWFTDSLTICDESPAFNDNAPMVLITEVEDSDNITIQKSFSQYKQLYQQIGTGVYMGEEIIADANTLVRYAQFLIVIDEETVHGIGIGTRIDERGTCSEYRTSTYEYLGPE